MGPRWAFIKSERPPREDQREEVKYDKPWLQHVAPWNSLPAASLGPSNSWNSYYQTTCDSLESLQWRLLKISYQGYMKTRPCWKTRPCFQKDVIENQNLVLQKGMHWFFKKGCNSRSLTSSRYIYTYPLQVTARVPTHLLRKNIKIIYVYNYILKPIVETIASIQETCIHVWSFMTCTSLLFCIFLLSQIPNRTLPITQTGLRVSFSSRRTPRFWRP